MSEAAFFFASINSSLLADFTMPGGVTATGDSGLMGVCAREGVSISPKVKKRKEERKKERKKEDQRVRLVGCCRRSLGDDLREIAHAQGIALRGGA